jgi:hypothetical protein
MVKKRSNVTLLNSVVELRHFFAAPASGKNFDAAPAAPAPAPTLLYKTTFGTFRTFLSVQLLCPQNSKHQSMLSKN